MNSLEQYIVEDLFDLDPYTPDSAIPSNDFNATDHSFQPRSTESLFVQHPLAQTNHFYSTLGPLPDLPLALDPGLLTSAPTLDPAQLHAPAHSPVPGPSRHRAVASTTHSIPSSSLSSLDSTPASTSSTKIPPSRTVSAPGVASKEDEAVSLWERSLAHLKEHLTPKRFTVAPSATYRAISDVLDTFTITSTNKRQSNWGDLSDVPPEGRFSILTTMLASARGEFWSAWLELENKSKTPSKGLDVIEKWLLGAVSTKATTLGTIENQLANTLLPLLQVLDRLPIKLEHLTTTKIGKAVKKISNSHSNEVAQDLAAALVKKWSELTKQEQPAQVVDKDLKRKVDAASGSKVVAKKAKVVAPSAATKSRTMPAGSGGAQEKVKLPSFKKNVPVDSYKEAMAKLKKVEPVVAPPVESDTAMLVTALSTGKGKTSEKKKSVRFNDAEIATFRIIESRFGDEAGGEEHESMSADQARDMMEQEGATLSELQNYMDEEVPWYEPSAIEFPLGDDFQNFLNPGQESAEVATQTGREDHVMAVEYSSRDEIPFSPSEPSDMSRDDSEPKIIPLSIDLSNDAAVQSDISMAQAQSAPMGGFASDLVLSNLLSALQPTSAGVDAHALAALRTHDPAAIQALLDRDSSLSGLAVSLQNAGVLANPANHNVHPDRQRAQASRWDAPSSTAWGRSSQEARPSAPARRGRGGTLSGRNGNRIPTICRFYKGPTGCTREEDCAFIHEG